jgi:uncharacterized protein YdeI (YjbR/CyaY-like superfamily)
MGTRDPRVDAYIAKSADFARPILTAIRDTVHAACPETVEEMKWSFPHFTYKGMLCGMAAFKQHCTFGFWKGSLVLGGSAKDADAMGQFGRITRVSDLPAKKAFTGYIKKAMALNDEGVKIERRPPRRATVDTAPPADLAAALKKNKKANASFKAFPPSHKREYIEWITEAKAAETRAHRLSQAIVWIAQGKSRNWKYEKRGG